MKKLFDYASAYIKTMSILDIGFLKICLLTLGILIGAAVKGKHKKTILLVSASLFTATYVMEMTKFIQGVQDIIQSEQKAAK